MPDRSADLLALLRDLTGRDDLDYAMSPEPLTGGFYAEMFRFSLADPPDGLAGDLVARLVRDSVPGVWEATIQRELTRQNFASPAVRLAAPTGPPLDRYLIVMDLVDGGPLLGGLSIGGVLAQLPTLARNLTRQLATIAADLHVLDPTRLAADLEALDSPMSTTVAGFVAARMAEAETAGRSDLAAAGQRLLDTEPATTQRVICHGDLHPFNVLATDHRPVLIDWTVARVAHPAFDIAYTQMMLANPPIPLPAAGKAALAPLAANMSKRFLAIYRRLRPDVTLDADTLRWHRSVHALRALVELAGWRAGGTRPPAHHPWVVLETVFERELGLVG